MICSNSAGNLGNGRKKLGLAPLAQWNHKNEAFLQWEKHGICNFFSNCPRWSAPKQSKNKKVAKKPIERIWQKPPKAKEYLDTCRENKPCAICLYVVTCLNSAGNLGNGRKKLGLVPLAQWNHKSGAFLQWERHGSCNFISSCPGWSAVKQRKN